jgi:hypothetical protein
MEFTFTPFRAGSLIVLLAIFALIGGFSPPWVRLGVDPSVVHSRPWLTCVLMFITGAAMTTVVDHWVGMMPPSNWRPLYVVGGVVLMIAAVVWYRAMLASWAMQTAA